MRAFLAIDLDDGARDAVVSAAEGLKSEPGWRRTRRENLHLTLAFFGEVEPEKYFFLTTMLPAALQEIEPFTLALAGGGRFPSGVRNADERDSLDRIPARSRRPSRPRVAWIGVREGGGSCAAVASSVSRVCESGGIRLEARAFHPHVTVARSKPGGRPASSRGLDAWIERLGDRPLGPPFRVAEVVLYESVLGPSGSVYRVLAKIPLGHGSA